MKEYENRLYYVILQQSKCHVLITSSIVHPSVCYALLLMVPHRLFEYLASFYVRFSSKSSCLPTNFAINGLLKAEKALVIENIVAAFRGMHVSPAKHSYTWLPRKWLLDRQTEQSDPYVPLCFAGDIKTGIELNRSLAYFDFLF